MSSVVAARTSLTFARNHNRSPASGWLPSTTTVSGVTSVTV
jgi:hypothetical protein